MNKQAPKPTQTNIHFSTRFLREQLSKGNTLAIQVDAQSTFLEKEKLVSYIEQKSIGTSNVEKIVIVGQAINITSLEKMVSQYFADASYVLVQAHHLSDEFPQQAVELSISRCNTSNTHINAAETGPSLVVANETLRQLANDFFVDAFRVTKTRLSTPGLLVMDMDSTIINMECIDEIAALAGVGEKVSALTERAMQGELDFNQSLYARVACLKGIELNELDKLKSRLPINPGFARTIEILQAHGWVTCIASGGFTYFANYLKDSFELNYAHSNVLSVENNVLGGSVEGDIVNGEMKKQILLQRTQEHNFDMQQTIAIGDGANDLLMMEAAGVGVAYKAKAKVQIAADANINYCGFEGLLYCLAP